VTEKMSATFGLAGVTDNQLALILI